MGQAHATAGVREVGVEGRNHMREVMAEDENLAYRRAVKLIPATDRQDIDSKVTERLRFCCEEEWKAYLRCMEGRSLSQGPECFPIKERANVCVEKLNRPRITATTEKRHVMGLLQGESRIRTSVNFSEWIKRADGVEFDSAAEVPDSQTGTS